MAPKSAEDAKAEQLRLAKELQQEFQRSGTFKGNPSGRGSSKPQVTSRRPSTQPLRQPAYKPAGVQPHNPDFARKAVPAARQDSASETRKRKMDTQAADFFAERPNKALERGPVQYYQGQNRAAAPSFPPTHTSPHTTTRTAQPAMFENSGMRQAHTALASMPVAKPRQIEVPQSPVIWHYQDGNEKPQPLARDESMMDMDMPDATPADNCTCTVIQPSGGVRGLGASRWAATSSPDRKLDVDCPAHGTRATAQWNGNGSGVKQSASENAPKPVVWYYQ